jgi:hypothetical protein
MNDQKKPNELVTQVRTVKISTQATLTCLAEDAFRAGDQSLYEELRELNKSFGNKCEEILQKRGAGAPKKTKVKLMVVK